MCFFHSQSNVISIFSQWSNELIYIFMHLFNQKLLEVGLGLFHRDLARGKIIRRVKKPRSEQLGFCIGIIRWPPMARLMGSCHTELKAAWKEANEWQKERIWRKRTVNQRIINRINGGDEFESLLSRWRQPSHFRILKSPPLWKGADGPCTNNKQAFILMKWCHQEKSSFCLRWAALLHKHSQNSQNICLFANFSWWAIAMVTTSVKCGKFRNRKKNVAVRVFKALKKFQSGLNC